MEQEYLSVRQFAKRAGVTTQRIYQMMNKSLKSYCKVEDGKKYISADGLKIFERAEMEKNSLQEVASDLPRPNFRSCNSKKTAYDADFSRENSETTEENLQGLAKDLPRPNFRSCNPLKDNLQEESNPNEQITKETIYVLQEQLAIKDKQIDEKDKQIAELTAMLKNSQEQQAALVQALTATQALAAADKQQLLLQAGQMTEQAVSDNIQTSENTKKGFFQRLFGK